MDRGNSQLGGDIELGCKCKDSNGVATAPDAAPTMYIFTATGTLVLQKQIPVQDRYGSTGLFGYIQNLNGSFATGHYHVLYTWLISSVQGAQIDVFNVLAGGSTQGQALSMHWKHGAQADHIVRQQDSGTIRYDRNPRV